MHAIHAKLEATGRPQRGGWVGTRDTGCAIGHGLHSGRWRRLARAGLVWLVILIPGWMGLSLIQDDVLQTRQLETSQEQRRVLSQLEMMLDEVHAAAVAAMPLADAPCESVLGALRRQAAVVPQVRSLLLARDGEVHCASLSGESGGDLGMFGGGQEALAFVAGSAVAPERPLLLYRWRQGSQQVIAVVDARHAWRAAIGRDVGDGAWRVAGMQLGNDGLAPSPIRPDAAAIASSRYPIEIVADAPGAMPRPPWRSFHVGVLLVLLAGIPGGYLIHRLMPRRQGRHREYERAIRKGEFVPYYQPLVRAADMEWAGVEVLARWLHPNRGLLAPDSFMTGLERSRFILPATGYLMERAAHELAGMLPQLPVGFHVSFNITPAHLAGRWLPELCQRFLSVFPQDRIILVLELTEREGVEADEDVHAVLEELRRMGVRIALDDFGVGHSNLSHLQDLRVDGLKIDRGFIARLGSPAGMTPILRTILDLAERMDLDVVAEGVETRAQADALIRHGVTLLQGYLFARPLAGQDLPSALSRTPLPPGAQHVDSTLKVNQLI